MSFPYTPVPAPLVTLTLPDDGDLRVAASVNGPFEQLADATGQLQTDIELSLARIQTQVALNFPIAIDVGQVADAAFYVNVTDVYYKWILLGDALVQYANENYQSGDVSGGLAALHPPLDGDSDTNGNIVVSSSDNNVLEYTVAGSWATYDCFASSLSAALSAVQYDPIHSLWCAVSVQSALKIRTSSNRTVWTNRTAPFGVSTDGPVRLKCNKATGRLVVANLPTSNTTVLHAYSDDGGQTWTNGTTLTSLANSTDLTLAYHPRNGVWMITAGKTAGSKVWTSTDGITFTLVATFTAAKFYSLVPILDIWVACVRNDVTNTEELAYSLDNGVTWNYAGSTGGFTTLTGIAASPDQILAFCSADLVHFGHRVIDEPGTRGLVT